MILIGDVRERLRTLPAGLARCCVTSPPYWGLRDYGHPGQLGLEATPEAYVAAMVDVFREVRRVLADDGTLWVNIGDSYASIGRSERKESPGVGAVQAMPAVPREVVWDKRVPGKKNAGFSWQLPGGIKPKDLCGIPWRLAFALQADGWYLRQDIIWSKPNPMPESVRDRCTKAHEYVFLFAKQERYYYDASAIGEESVTNDPRRPRGSKGANMLDARGEEAQGQGNLRSPPNVKRGGFNGKTNATPGREAFRAFTETRNCRSVWTITTKPYSGAHFATFPEELPERCIKAGSAIGDTVLDPFLGSGTTIAVARKLGRAGVGIEINPEYAALARDRIGMAEKPSTYVQQKDADAPLFLGGV